MQHLLKSSSVFKQRESGSSCWLLRCPANTVRCMCQGPATSIHILTLIIIHTHISISCFYKQTLLGFICINAQNLNGLLCNGSFLNSGFKPLASNVHRESLQGK